jgi:hypothetical protein
MQSQVDMTRHLRPKDHAVRPLCEKINIIATRSPKDLAAIETLIDMVLNRLQTPTVQPVEDRTVIHCVVPIHRKTEE